MECRTMSKFIEYGETINGDKLFAKVDENGLVLLTCVAEYPEYQAWLNPVEHLTEIPTPPAE
jgi:hypothetical protein